MNPAVFSLVPSAHEALCYNEIFHVLYVRILNSVGENKSRKASEAIICPNLKGKLKAEIVARAKQGPAVLSGPGSQEQRQYNTAAE